MKDGKTQSAIAQLLNRHKSTISREIGRNTGLKGYYRLIQACLLAEERSLGSRNATQIIASDWDKAVDSLLAQWSPVYIANQVAALAMRPFIVMSALIKRLAAAFGRSCAAKRNARRAMLVGRDHRSQIVGRRTISERPAYIKTRSQAAHWEGDTALEPITSKR